MFKDYETLILDLKTGSNKRLVFKQNDKNSRFIQCNLVNGSRNVSVGDSRVDMYIRKSNKQVIFKQCYIYSADDGLILIDITQDMLSTVGEIECEIVIKGTDSSTLSFPIFKISVTDSIYDESAVEVFADDVQTYLTSRINENTTSQLSVLDSYKDYESINVDLKNGAKQSVSFKQNDQKSRFLQVCLTKNNEEIDISNSRVDIYVKKKNGDIVFKNCQVYDATKGLVMVEMTQQMLTTVGVIECEFLITGVDNSLLSFPVFKITVNESIYDSNAIESVSEFTALTEALNGVNNIDSRFQQHDIKISSLTESVNSLCVNVKNFGAIGNGINDDTSAFESAITSISSGGVVFVPNGNYVISDTLLLSTGQSIKGESKTGTILIGKTSNSPIIRIVGSHFEVDNIRIIFDYQRTESSSGCVGIELGDSSLSNAGAHEGVISNVIIEKSYRGIAIPTWGGQPFAFMNTFKNIRVLDSYDFAFHLAGRMNVGLTTNTFINCYALSQTKENGANPNNSGFHIAMHDDFTMINCACDHSQGRALELMYNKGGTIIDFHAEACNVNANYRSIAHIESSSVHFTNLQTVFCLYDNTITEAYSVWIGGASNVTMNRYRSEYSVKHDGQYIFGIVLSEDSNLILDSYSSDLENVFNGNVVLEGIASQSDSNINSLVVNDYLNVSNGFSELGNASMKNVSAIGITAGDMSVTNGLITNYLNGTGGYAEFNNVGIHGSLSIGQVLSIDNALYMNDQATGAKYEVKIYNGQLVLTSI